MTNLALNPIVWSFCPLRRSIVVSVTMGLWLVVIVVSKSVLHSPIRAIHFRGNVDARPLLARIREMKELTPDWPGLSVNSLEDI